MRPRRLQAGTGRIWNPPPYVFCGGRRPAEAVPRVELSPFVESETVGTHSICARGGLPCRKRGHGRIWNPPLRFLWRAEAPLQKAVLPRGVFSLCRKRNCRGAFYMRPRKFAFTASGHGRIWNPPPTFLWRAESPQRRCPAWSFSLCRKRNSVGTHSICARVGLRRRERARADMESAPTFFVAGGVPAEAVPRVEFSPFVESEIRRGAFYMRPRRFILPQAGTGGYGIRPYIFVGAAKGCVFALLCVQADLFPLAPCQKPSYVVYYFSTSPQANPAQAGDAKL